MAGRTVKDEATADGTELPIVFEDAQGEAAQACAVRGPASFSGNGSDLEGKSDKDGLELPFWRKVRRCCIFQFTLARSQLFLFRGGKSNECHLAAKLAYRCLETHASAKNAVAQGSTRIPHRTLRQIFIRDGK
jgi:hypothetical protein